MKCRMLFVIMVSISLLGNAQTVTLSGGTELFVDTIVTGLDVPWEITKGADGWIWYTERAGRVGRVQPDTKVNEQLLDITGQVYQLNESGLLGLALHPDFPDSAYCYIVYTYQQSSQIYERLVRYYFNGVQLVNEEILLDNIHGNTTHDGSRIHFMPDGTLLMTTGDYQNQNSPQDLSSLNGKILRLNADGTVPSDNPRPGSYVYSSGHRNPQGILYHPNGNIYSSEHGPTNDDEFQIIEAGGNYGWPVVEGYCDSPPEVTFCNDSNVIEPMLTWTPTIAPADIAWYGGSEISEWENSILMAVLKDKMLVSLKLNASGDSVIAAENYLNNQFGRLRDVLVDGDTIYLATNGASWSNIDPFTHSIIRLRTLPTVICQCKIGHSNIYPNPTKDLLYLSVEHAIFPINYEVYDMTGKIVDQGNWRSLDLPLNVSTYEPGLYFLRFPAIEYSAKFMVQ